MSSIINFPEDTNSNDSTTKQSYSQKLMWALRNFITETGSGYYDDRIDEGILSMYYALSEVDVKIHVEVTVTEESYRCKIQMHCHLDPDHENYGDAVLLLLYDLNKINMEIEDGCFTLDSNTGNQERVRHGALVGGLVGLGFQGFLLCFVLFIRPYLSVLAASSCDSPISL